MDTRIIIGLVATLLLAAAAPVSADGHHPNNGEPCHLGHDYGGCWVEVGPVQVGVCLYTPDGCPPLPIK